MPLLQDLREKPHEFWRTVALAVSAGAAVVAFSVAVCQFRAQVNGAKLERTLALLEKANVDAAAPSRCCAAPVPAQEAEDAKWRAIEDRRAILRYFPDRFKKVPEPLTKIGEVIDISRYPGPIPPDKDKREAYEKWDTARRHLNQLEIFAFAYVNGYVDRELLATAECAQLARSNVYFGPLIKAFRDELGLAQSWQIIPHAVKLMERDYGKGCEKLYAKLAN